MDAPDPPWALPASAVIVIAFSNISQGSPSTKVPSPQPCFSPAPPPQPAQELKSHSLGDPQLQLLSEHVSRECSEALRGCRILLLSLISCVTAASSPIPHFPHTAQWLRPTKSTSDTSQGLLAAGAELTVFLPHGETETGQSKAGLGGPDLVCAPTAPSTLAATISCSFPSLQPDSPESAAAERPSPVMLY